MSNPYKYKINYQGSSKVIKRIVDKLNNLALLGLTHEEAFYGDWGYEAYQHSHVTSGNPHKVNLEDLGIENLPRRVQMLMEALGSSNYWGTHNTIDGEPEAIVDHEGDFLVLSSMQNAFGLEGFYIDDDGDLCQE